jgi:hypothetical protein
MSSRYHVSRHVANTAAHRSNNAHRRSYSSPRTATSTRCDRRMNLYIHTIAAHILPNAVHAAGTAVHRPVRRRLHRRASATRASGIGAVAAAAQYVRTAASLRPTIATLLDARIGLISAIHHLAADPLSLVTNIRLVNRAGGFDGESKQLSIEEWSFSNCMFSCFIPFLSCRHSKHYHVRRRRSSSTRDTKR